MFDDIYEFDYDRIVDDTDELYDDDFYDDDNEYDYTNESEYDYYYHNVVDELDHE